MNNKLNYKFLRFQILECNFEKNLENRYIRSIAVMDSLNFLDFIDYRIRVPIFSTSHDGEILFTWYNNYLEKSALVSFEGDGYYGYCYYVNDRFIPGKELGIAKNKIPQDLHDYLFLNLKYID